MKTAISIPDDIFASGEELAKKLQISRSELYTKAIAAYLKNSRSSQITDKLNQVYQNVDSKLSLDITQMQFSSLEEEQW
jgi:metal-responsive CopG/Arc/MetJ family transcriptional regulator